MKWTVCSEQSDKKGTICQAAVCLLFVSECIIPQHCKLHTGWWGMGKGWGVRNSCGTLIWSAWIHWCRCRVRSQAPCFRLIVAFLCRPLFQLHGIFFTVIVSLIAIMFSICWHYHCFFLHMCVMSVHVHMDVDMCVGSCVCRSQRSMSRVFLSCSPSNILRQSLPCKPRIYWLH